MSHKKAQSYIIEFVLLILIGVAMIGGTFILYDEIFSPAYEKKVELISNKIYKDIEGFHAIGYQNNITYMKYEYTIPRTINNQPYQIMQYRDKIIFKYQNYIREYENPNIVVLGTIRSSQGKITIIYENQTIYLK